MAFTVTRSTDEILRLTRAQWASSSEIVAFLVDASAAAPVPTAASSTATWLTYANIDPTTSSFSPYYTPSSGTFTYSVVNQRAQAAPYTFSFNLQIANEWADFTSTTVTHVVFADVFGLYVSTSSPPHAVLEEATPLTLTSSSTLSYSLQLYGKAA